MPQRLSFFIVDCLPGHLHPDNPVVLPLKN
jgi:hypothetical protein